MWWGLDGKDSHDGGGSQQKQGYNGFTREEWAYNGARAAVEIWVSGWPWLEICGCDLGDGIGELVF